MTPQSEIFTHTLSDGTQVVGQPMSGVQSAAIGFFIGAGARDEHTEHAGISHLTESLMFRGTERLSSRDLNDRLDALGIMRDSSAGIEMTLFSGVMLGEHLAAAIDLFTDVLRSPSFPADDLEAVRGLQLQEIAQRQDQPAQLVMDRLRRNYFAGSPLSHDVLGNVDTVSSLTRQQITEYWRDRYTGNNVVVAVSGNFDWDGVIDQLERVTAAWGAGSGRLLVHEPQVRVDVEIEQQPLAQENIGFAFPGVAYGAEHYYEAALVSIALGGGMNSRLFTEVREKRGLAYSVAARFDGLEKTGLTRVYAGTQPERAHETVEVTQHELAKLEETGITAEELHLAKTRLKSHLIMRSESTVARMMSIGRDWWYTGNVRTLHQVREQIDRVTVESTLAYLQSLNLTGNLAMVAIGPVESSKFQVPSSKLSA